VAQKISFTVTATKIVSGAKKAVTYSGSGKDVTLFTANVISILPIGASDEDVLITLVDGSQITGQMAFDDLNTDLSATDQTGS
jgi:methylaspartate ammonia-lyase